ncbi:hypothetical protein COCMIDRAFT_103392 [Bipolaris oryzae ATCC 44560]|uniref:Uncharacterized protein n=1 Tax=Bipolaris oryzae ATCC 44560 TaxID=930090 RepID=W6YY00_COCMI|nr:uncharacterized protein COCMIDRAFT_103392 [Bipolaris oryzae ATCC 44560]EUC42460.1 hypothetical protein COCMIDRAFT_103392 [Bipolaris oryzae ATCC 44560]
MQLKKLFHRPAKGPPGAVALALCVGPAKDRIWSKRRPEASSVAHKSNVGLGVTHIDDVLLQRANEPHLVEIVRVGVNQGQHGKSTCLHLMTSWEWRTTRQS